MKSRVIAPFLGLLLLGLSGCALPAVPLGVTAWLAAGASGAAIVNSVTSAGVNLEKIFTPPPLTGGPPPPQP